MFVRYSAWMATIFCTAIFVTAGCTKAQTSDEAVGASEKTIAESAASHLANNADAPDEHADEVGGDAASGENLFGTADEQEPVEADEVEATGEEVVASEPGGTAAHALAYYAEEIAARDAKIHELTQRIAALETDIQSMQNTVASFSSALASMQNNDDFTRKALGAMAEDGDLRAGFGEMLQGKVRLVNNTGDNKVLYINGTPWTVVTGNSYVFAPVGTVSFLREGEEEPTFKGVQEWTEGETLGRYELTYELGEAATESSVLKDLPEQQ